MISLVNEAPAVGDISARKHREKGQGTNLAANSRLVKDRGEGGGAIPYSHTDLRPNPKKNMVYETLCRSWL